MQCTNHPDTSSTSRCRRCGQLLCERCLWETARRPVCMKCAGRSRERRGWAVPLLVTLLVPSLLAPLVMFGLDKIIDTRKRRNERAAVDALRIMAEAQARFLDGEPRLVRMRGYATNLAELGSLGLIDGALSDGTFQGYHFGLSGSTYDWFATAAPISPSTGDRKFRICSDGVVRFSDPGYMACAGASLR